MVEPPFTILAHVPRDDDEHVFPVAEDLPIEQALDMLVELSGPEDPEHVSYTLVDANLEPVTPLEVTMPFDAPPTPISLDDWQYAIAVRRTILARRIGGQGVVPDPEPDNGRARAIWSVMGNGLLDDANAMDLLSRCRCGLYLVTDQTDRSYAARLRQSGLVTQHPKQHDVIVPTVCGYAATETRPTQPPACTVERTELGYKATVVRVGDAQLEIEATTAVGLQSVLLASMVYVHMDEIEAAYPALPPRWLWTRVCRRGVTASLNDGRTEATAYGDGTVRCSNNPPFTVVQAAHRLAMLLETGAIKR